MTVFGYTSGNPNNLTAGGNASMADIQGPFVDLRDFLNNGGIDTSNLATSAGIKETQLASGTTGLVKGSFSAYRNAALSLASNGVVAFDTEEWDVSSWFDITTNVGRFTPQVPGYYRFNWKVAYTGPFGADSFLFAGLWKNAAANKWAPIQYQRGAQEISAGGSALAVANGSTDFFTVVVQHNQGGTPVVTTGIANTYFQGEMVGRI